MKQKIVQGMVLHIFDTKFGKITGVCFLNGKASFGRLVPAHSPCFSIRSCAKPHAPIRQRAAGLAWRRAAQSTSASIGLSSTLALA